MSTTINQNERNIPLRSLLPYDIASKKGTQLASALHEYRMLLTATDKAMTAFESRDFEQFDALVGENMCQIRSVKIAMIAASLGQTVGVLKNSLQCVTEKVDLASAFVTKKTQGSLEDLFVQKNLDLMLTAHELFMTQTYLLTVVKVVKPAKGETPFLANEESESKNLLTLSEISVGFAKTILKNLQKQVAAASVAFIRQCAPVELIPTVAEELVWRTQWTSNSSLLLCQ